jgi:hypothetical protein
MARGIFIFTLSSDLSSGAVNLAGDSNEWAGLILAPNGLVSTSGSKNSDLAGMIVGYEVDMSGSNMSHAGNGLVRRSNPGLLVEDLGDTMKQLIQRVKYREAGRVLSNLHRHDRAIILLGGLFDVGRAFLILVAVENSAAEGALYGVTHPECMAPDRGTTVCRGMASITGRVIEEAKPVVTISEEYITLALEDGSTVLTITTGADIVPGQTLRVDVKYTYSPVTPVGFMIWGDKAEVKVSARQPILSPPPPGYTY